MAERADLEFTYSLIDRIFRLSLGELADFSGAKYDGDFSLSLEAAQRQFKACTLKSSRKPTVSANSKCSTLQPRSRSYPLSRLRNKLPVVEIFVLGVKLLQARGRQLPSVWLSPSGIAWRRRRHFISQSPGMTLRRSVKRPTRQCGGTLLKPLTTSRRKNVGASSLDSVCADCGNCT